MLTLDQLQWPEKKKKEDSGVGKFGGDKTRTLARNTVMEQWLTRRVYTDRH